MKLAVVAALFCAASGAGCVAANVASQSVVQELCHGLCEVDGDDASLLQARRAASARIVQQSRSSSERASSGQEWWKAYGSDATTASAAIAAQLTWEELSRLVVGLGYSWDQYNPRQGYFAGTVQGIPRLHVPATNSHDAGQGFRTHTGSLVGTVTSWPSTLAAVSTWDTELMARYASGIGKEFSAKGANGVLGPGVDIVRVPMGGRNSESLAGEEPWLGSKMAYAYVSAMQAEGVACMAKHFVLNTQETNRNSHNNVASQRALWEIHYPSFEAAIEAGLAGVMCAYNGANGAKSCLNSNLLKHDLKGALGFKGFVLSDWWAVSDKETAVTNGLDQMMPGNNPSGNTPTWDMHDLQTVAGRGHVQNMAQRVLYGMISSSAFDKPSCTPGKCENLYSDVTSPAHTATAREVASAAVVLLKNDGGILPLAGTVRIALIGSACGRAQTLDPTKLGWNEGDYYVVGGSGRVLSPKTQSVRQAFVERGISLSVVDETDDADAALVRTKNANAQVLVACGGVTSGEDLDRTSLKLDHHDFLVDVTKRAKEELGIHVVVLTMSTGSIITDGFGDSADAVLSAMLLGQETGRAFVDVLLGTVNPSGRLPVTFPARQADMESVCTAPTCELQDDVHIGWRGLIGRPVSFPFGHGLSFTNFSYSWVSRPVVAQGGSAGFGVAMEVSVKNSGGHPGREVVQLYVAFPAHAGNPGQVLRGFHRTGLLPPGGSENVKFDLGARELSTWWDCEADPSCDVRTCYGTSCYTCGERMAWHNSPDGGGSTQQAALEAVKLEFPAECARCAGPKAVLLQQGVASIGGSSQSAAGDSRAAAQPSEAAAAQYMGCFRDEVSDRDLSEKRGTGTYEDCARQCQGFAFFGRQWEQECWCANDYGKHGAVDGCKCEAYNIGGDRNCVYRAPSAVPAESKYVGCFADTLGDRDLPVFAGLGDAKFCALSCEGYKYYARQWEQECFCGNSYGKHGPEENCQCDAFNIGGDRNCVYRRDIFFEPTSSNAPSSTLPATPTPAGECTTGWRKADGTFGVFVSASSRDDRLHDSFELLPDPTT